MTTTAPDLVPSTMPRGEKRAGGRKRWVAVAGVSAIFLGGLGAGLLITGSTAGLDSARSSLHSSNERIKQLESDLADAQESGDSLTESLEEANAKAASAGAEAKATQKRLDARAAKLDERDQALDEREQNLDAYDDTVPASGGLAEDTATSGGDFDRAYAIEVGNDIVEEIRTVDSRMRDGIAVSSALSLLSDDYGRLLTAGIPPGVNEARYYARVTTLQTFAGDAADLYDIDATQGSAKYAVTREQTGRLLDQLNDAVGSHFQLP